MTPTTATKSPVDTIREYLLDRKSALDASLKYVMPYNVQKLIEDEFLRVCELLTALSSLSTQPAQTMMSTDYEALYELLCKGGEALGLVSLQRAMNPTVPIRVIRIAPWRIAISQFGSVTPEFNNGVRTELEAFIAECTRLKLEWVAPLPSQTDPAPTLEKIVDAAMIVRDWCEVANDGMPKHQHREYFRLHLKTDLTKLLSA